MDERILWELVRDARLPNNALAARLGIAPSTALARTRRLVDLGVIRGSHAAVDLRSVGLPLQALIAVLVKPMARDQMRSFAVRTSRLPPVLNLYCVGGEIDFLVHVACTSTEHLNSLVTDMLSSDPVVAGTRTYLVFEHYGMTDTATSAGGFALMRGQ